MAWWRRATLGRHDRAAPLVERGVVVPPAPGLGGVPPPGRAWTSVEATLEVLVPPSGAGAVLLGPAGLVRGSGPPRRGRSPRPAVASRPPRLDGGELGWLRRRRARAERLGRHPAQRHWTTSNTRDLAWSAGVPYRLRIRRATERRGGRGGASDGLVAWRGEVTDLSTGQHHGRARPVGRRHRPGRAGGVVGGVRPLRRPGVVVRWSDLRLVDQAGRRPRSRAGCRSATRRGPTAAASPPTCRSTSVGVRQATGTVRRTPPGAAGRPSVRSDRS